MNRRSWPTRASCAEEFLLREYLRALLGSEDSAILWFETKFSVFGFRKPAELVAEMQAKGESLEQAWRAVKGLVHRMYG